MSKSRWWHVVLFTLVLCAPSTYVIAAPGTATPIATTKGRMINYDLPGSTFFEFSIHRDFAQPPHEEIHQAISRESLPLADQCHTQCTSNSRCKAWTVIVDRLLDAGPRGQARINGRCFLKDAVPAPVARPRAISGLKPQPPTNYGRPKPSEAPPSTPPTSLRLPEGSTTIQENTNLPGHDYRAEDLDDAQPTSCARICLRDPQCRAWTAVKPGGQSPRMRCWLKDAVPRPTHDQCCTSGVTRQRVSDTDSRAAPSKSWRQGLPPRSP